MPFTLHPSGYAVFYSDVCLNNLKHDQGGCKAFTAKRSRRGKFFDRVAAIYFMHRKLHLWTFTVPTLQQDYETTDKFYTSQFSKLTENYKKQGLISSYVYVVEAQRRGNIHFHLVTSSNFIPVKKINDYWCTLINDYSKSAVDLEVIDNKGIDRIPAYLAKYMAKSMEGKAHSGSGLKGRIIHARTFNSSRDLSAWHPIKVNAHELPTHLEHRKRERVFEVPDKETGEIRKFTLTDYFFKSDEVIRYFGHEFTR